VPPVLRSTIAEPSKAASGAPPAYKPPPPAAAVLATVSAAAAVAAAGVASATVAEKTYEVNAARIELETASKSHVETKSDEAARARSRMNLAPPPPPPTVQTKNVVTTAAPVAKVTPPLPVPKGWVASVSKEGIRYYINLQTGHTQWLHPQGLAEPGLPYGWTKVENHPTMGTFYMDHINKRCSRQPPSEGTKNGPAEPELVVHPEMAPSAQEEEGDSGSSVPLSQVWRRRLSQTGESPDRNAAGGSRPARSLFEIPKGLAPVDTEEEDGDGGEPSRGRTGPVRRGSQRRGSQRRKAPVVREVVRYRLQDGTVLFLEYVSCVCVCMCVMECV
jgi:hypothetical protein